MKKSLLLVAVLAGLAAGPAAPAVAQRAGQEKVSVDIIGYVRSIDREQLTVESRGQNFRVHVQDVRDVRRLRTGDQVRVFGVLRDRDTVDAEKVLLHDRSLGTYSERDRDRDRGTGRDRDRDRDRERDILGRPIDDRDGRKTNLVGTIQRMDASRRTMRIRDDRRKNIDVEWTDKTEFVRGQSRSSAASFTPGSRVHIVAREIGDSRYRARIVSSGSRPGWSSGAVGEIVESSDRGRRIEVDYLGEIWRVELSGAQIRDRSGRRLDARDLTEGQLVRIDGRARGSRTIEASSIEVVNRIR